MLLLLLVACSDYKLEPEGEDPSGAIPDVEVTPAAVTDVVCAPPLATSVRVSNAGSATLTVENLVVDGAGWALDPVALPVEIAPDEALTVGLVGEGDGTLYVVTDDPDEDTIVVPLSVGADAPPTVRIDAPGEGAVFADTAALDLVGFVDDDVDAPEALAVVWTAGGVEVSTAAADASGVTRATWGDRATGPQEVTLSATDACGSTTTTTVGVCQDGAFTYDALDLTSWHYEGSARFDEGNAWLQLTDFGKNLVGSAFETSSVVSADIVTIDFAFYIGGGTGADGISLTALDTTRMTGFLGGTGCGMGFGGDAPCTAGPALPGWSIEVDTYYNADADPTDQDHVAFMFDGDADAPVAWAALPEMEDTGWHQMSVTVAAPRVTVAIDGVTWIDGDYAGSYTFPAYVGFTAGTGTLTNYHLIDSLLVTEYVCGG